MTIKKWKYLLRPEKQLYWRISLLVFWKCLIKKWSGKYNFYAPMMYLLVPNAVFQAEHKRFPNCSKTKSTSENEVMKPISDRKSLKIHLRRRQRRKKAHYSLAAVSTPPSPQGVLRTCTRWDVQIWKAQRSDILSKETNFHNYLLSLTLCSTKAAGLFLVLKCFVENIAQNHLDFQHVSIEYSEVWYNLKSKHLNLLKAAPLTKGKIWLPCLV